MQVVCVGDKASLTVLKFVRKCAEKFSFEWSKVGDEDTQPHLSKPNTVTFQSVCEEDFGHYQCEVKEAEKVVLTVHTALYREETSTFTNNQPIIIVQYFTCCMIIFK